MNSGGLWSTIKQAFSWSVLKETYKEWSDDKASRLAAALAYYTATAMGPLIIGILAIAGFVFSREQAKEQLVAQINKYVGGQGAQMIETIVNNADQPDLARLAGLLSLVTLIWSASNIFAQLQDALDTVWGVELRRDLPLMRKIQHRLLPLATVIGVGLLLLVAIIASAALSTIGGLVSGLLPGGALLWQIVNFVISLAIITLLFGVVFKVLPDVEISWRDVWPGAALTAILFVVGQFVLGWYLGRQSGASVYGAAGSLIVFLLWLYYTTQIFMFGAEFTQVYATRYGEGVRPSEDAVARDQAVAAKPAARAARGEFQQVDAQGGQKKSRAAALARSTSFEELDQLPVHRLLRSIVDDVSALYRQEIQLARAEVSAIVTKVTRGAAFTVGGGLVIYAAFIIILLAVALVLQTIMPAWLAVLLVGILTLIEGWIVINWARGRLAKLYRAPRESIESIRQDAQVVKGHLMS